MNIEEISVGDYLLCPDGKARKVYQFGRIAYQIPPNDFVESWVIELEDGMICGQQRCVTYGLDKLKPVPLDESFLEKNFVKRETIYLKFGWQKRVEVKITREVFSEGRHARIMTWRGRRDGWVKNLHELQHLFRDMRIKKEFIV